MKYRFIIKRLSYFVVNEKRITVFEYSPNIYIVIFHIWKICALIYFVYFSINFDKKNCSLGQKPRNFNTRLLVGFITVIKKMLNKGLRIINNHLEFKFD